jgi:MFS family permease
MVLFFILVALFTNIKDVKTERSDIFRSVKKIVSSRLIILIALTGIGTMVVETIISQFLVYYLESIHYSDAVAGSVSAIFLIIGFPGGIIGGYHFSHTKHKIGTFVAVNLIISSTVILIPFVHSIAFIVILAAVTGMLAVYGFSIPYIFIRYLARRDLVSLTLSFVNTIQLSVAVTVPVIFTVLVSQFNYTISWLAMGIIGLAFLPLIFAIKDGLKKAIPS